MPTGMNKEPQRETVANKVMEQALSVVEQAEKLAERAGTKLQPVMQMQVVSAKGGTVEQKTAEQYPPLFDSLRSYLDRIQAAIESINQMLSRTEL